MYMSREVFHCKPGKAKEIVSLFKNLTPALVKRGFSAVRIYTDVSGEEYWTVVVEQEMKTIDELAEISRTTMSDPEIASLFKGYHDHVVGGRREIYKVE